MIVELTDESKYDLRIIRENLNNFNDSGTKFVDEITKDMEKLADNPKIGPTLNTKIDVVTDYRYMVFPFTKKLIYMIIYRIDERKKMVYINRVFDSRMDYLNVLFKD